jgi:hypothetical protein
VYLSPPGRMISSTVSAVIAHHRRLVGLMARSTRDSSEKLQVSGLISALQ